MISKIRKRQTINPFGVLVALLTSVLLLSLTGVRSVYAASITVDTTADDVANDGACSLRAPPSANP